MYSLRTNSTLSKYGLVFLLLFSLVIAKLYLDHDASHLIKPDNHCALCLSAASDGHVIPPLLIIFNNSTLPDPAIQADWAELHLSVVATTGNRDPPETLNS